MKDNEKNGNPVITKPKTDGKPGTTQKKEKKVKHKNIHEAILWVMERVNYVQKDTKISAGRNSYTVATERNFIKKVRPLFVEAGIYAAPIDIQTVNLEMVSIDYGNKTSNKIHHAHVYTYRLTHAPSGTSIDVKAGGEAFGNDDKGFNKAATASYKYACMRQVLMIETGDDPDLQPGLIDGRPVRANKLSKSELAVAGLRNRARQMWSANKTMKTADVFFGVDRQDLASATAEQWTSYCEYLGGAS